MSLAVNLKGYWNPNNNFPNPLNILTSSGDYLIASASGYSKVTGTSTLFVLGAFLIRVGSDLVHYDSRLQKNRIPVIVNSYSQAVAQATGTQTKLITIVGDYSTNRNDTLYTYDGVVGVIKPFIVEFERKRIVVNFYSEALIEAKGIVWKEIKVLRDETNGNKITFYNYDGIEGKLSGVGVDANFPVRTVNGKTGDVIILPNVKDVDTTSTANIVDSTNKRFVTDAQKTAIDNAVPNTRTVNGVSLTGNITLTKANFSDLNNVNNTSDLNKPISNATQTALDVKISGFYREFYLDAVAGNDANDGSTAALAIKNLHQIANIARNKYVKITINVVGNYTLNQTAHFIVPEVAILLQEGTTFTFNSFTNGGLGGATNPIIMEGNRLVFQCFNGSTTRIVVAGHSGPTSGNSNNYYYHIAQGAIRCGNTSISNMPTKVYIINVGVTVGTYTVLVTGRDGESSDFLQPDIEFNIKSIPSWTVDTNSKICSMCSKSYFRKSILFNTANTWKEVGSQSELKLLNGSYAVSVNIDTSGGGGGLYAGKFSGIMSWTGSDVNDGQNESREIVLHGMGNDLNGHSIKLRTVTQGTRAVLEASIDETLSSAIILQFFFTKLN